MTLEMEPGFVNTLRKPKRLRAGWIGMLLGLAALTARGAATNNVQDRLPFQGYLMDGNGTVLGQSAPAKLDVVFRIFVEESGGDPLWSEQQTIVVDRGTFSVWLGQGGPYRTEPHASLTTVFAGATASDRYIETTVLGIGPGGTDSSVTPRSRLLSTAYAYRSARARTADAFDDGSGNSVVSVVGARVGVNQPNPMADLDVGGAIAADGLQASQSLVVTGTAAATAWEGIGAVPVGSIILWSGDAVPAGWALCNGQTVNGKTTPDLRGRFVLGAGAAPGRTERLLGQVGGSEQNQLGVSTLTIHAHWLPPQSAAVIGGGHTHSYLSAAHTDPPPTGTRRFGDHWYYGDKDIDSTIPPTIGANKTSEGSNQSHSHWFDIPEYSSGASGGSQPYDKMPPYYALAYIMRVD